MATGYDIDIAPSGIVLFLFVLVVVVVNEVHKKYIRSNNDAVYGCQDCFCVILLISKLSRDRLIT